MFCLFTLCSLKKTTDAASRDDEDKEDSDELTPPTRKGCKGWGHSAAKALPKRSSRSWYAEHKPSSSEEVLPPRVTSTHEEP
jgi:hypothetical protein